MRRRMEFPVDEIDSAVVHKYRPTFMNYGGESLVYGVPEHPEVVIKANKESMANSIAWNRRHGQELSILTGSLKKWLQQQIRNDSARFAQLKQYFAAKHILPQKRFVLRVPVTPDILTEVTHNFPEVAISELPAIVTVQRRLPDIDAETSADFTAGYAEHMPDLDLNAYVRATDFLVFGRDIDPPFSVHDLNALVHISLARLYRESVDNTPLQQKLAEFVRGAILFTNSTGDILDTAGSRNIVFTNIRSTPSFVLIDPLAPRDDKTGSSVARTRLAFSRLSEGKELASGDKSVLLNVLNYVRAVNGIAFLLGIPDRISVIPSPDGAWDSKLDVLYVIDPLRKHFAR